MFGVSAGSASDAGRRHEINEDRVLAGRTVFAVADGTGGRAAGEVASALAVARLGRLDGEPATTPEVFRTHLAAANADILASGAQDPRRHGMAASIAGIGIVQVAGTDHWVVFNVGDCRVYRLAEDRLTRLTLGPDADAAEPGAGAPAVGAGGTARAGRRHTLPRSLGSDPAPEPDIRVLPPVAGERFLICSDGLSLELADSVIAEVLRTQQDPGAAARHLVRTAAAAGGRDDASAVVVDHSPAAPGAGDGGAVPRQLRTSVFRS